MHSTSVSGDGSRTACTGRFAENPPSQYHRPSISVGGRSGRRPMLATKCSGRIAAEALSTTRDAPVSRSVRLTASRGPSLPILSRSTRPRRVAIAGAEVVERGIAPARLLQEQAGQVRPVQPGPAQQARLQGGERLGHAPRVAGPGSPEWPRLGDPVPERVQTLQPLLRRIARDQRGVERADRAADQSVRPASGLGERLTDPGLEGTKRAAAAEHQRHAPGRPPTLRSPAVSIRDHPPPSPVRRERGPPHGAPPRAPLGTAADRLAAARSLRRGTDLNDRAPPLVPQHLPFIERGPE